MGYPENTYPDDPDFPGLGFAGAKYDENLYKVTSLYLDALTKDIGSISDNAGNLDFTLSKGIGWDSTVRIECPGGTVEIDKVEIASAPSTPWVYGELAAVNATLSNDLTIGASATATFTTDLNIVESIIVTTVDDTTMTMAQISEPDDPTDDGYGKMWHSNGTGYGDAGDVCIKIKRSGSTKTKTLVDFSTL